CARDMGDSPLRVW
nr:immunoglobulin heavy chain junction region [Macaca mulatta]MOW90530.1 immunoglobulin heavy chain junction region [Macaca mulatta]MOW92268.1 immunoglobulin heavy chain junction region [Macaca mulatta]MOW92473.1 immunoglobulin heavy chain junction region [Macaca mulatta]